MSRLFQKDPSGAVLLSEHARELPLDDLHAALAEAGYAVSRTTAWRAKRGGRFTPGYREGSRRLAGDHVGWVRLHATERQLGPSELARRMGIDVTTAARAIERGWFSVTKGNREKVTVDASRIREGAPPAREASPLAPLVPAVLQAAPDGRPIASLAVAEIVAIFGLSRGKAARARQRGEIRTRGWPLARLRDLARRLAEGKKPDEG
jgi:hypothetical protein